MRTSDWSSDLCSSDLCSTPAAQTTLSGLLAAGIHAGLQFVRVLPWVDPRDAQRQPLRRRPVFEQRGAGTVRQHPAKEVLLESDHRLGFEGGDACLVLGLEVPRAHIG